MPPDGPGAPRRLWYAAACSAAPPPRALLVPVMLGAAMSGLDASIVNTVLPRVAGALATDPASAQWIVTSYLLTLSGLLLSAGRLGDLRGHRPVYLSGFAVFALGSALCGLAPALPFLVAARVLQALGAAMLAASSPAILTAVIPLSQRGRAFGMYALAVYVGFLLGPGLGGLLTDHWSWRAVFYATVPVGVLALAVSYCTVPAEIPASVGESFDALGAVSFSLGLVALLLGLNQGHTWGWAAPATMACFALAGVGLVLFVRVEQCAASPLLNLSLFRSRLFSAAIVTAMLNYVASFSVLFLMPYYLLDARGLTATQTGFVFSAMPVAMAVGAPVSGVLSDRFGSRALATGGMALLALGTGILSQLSADTPLANVVAALLAVGLGSGAFTPPNTSAALSAAPSTRRGVASAVLGTGRYLGMALGVGIAGAVFTTVLARETSATAPLALVHAVDAGLMLAAGLALLGAVTAAARA